MTKQNINTGSSANDGTGDTLRAAAIKVNANFQEIYTQLGGDTLSALVGLKDSAGTGVVIFEGSSVDSHETKLIATNATADRTIQIPNATGIIVLKDTTDTLTNKTLTTPTIASITNGGTVTIPSGADTLVARTSTDTLTNKTLTTPTLNSPKIGTLINDTNGNEIIKFTATASALNEFTIANGASGAGPTLSATGGGADLNISLTPKGKGSVTISKAAFSSDEFDSNGHNGGQADSSSSLVICNSGTALAVGLGPGTTVGEFKIFTNKGSGLATITPAPFANGASFSLTTNHATQCIWDGAKWFMLNGADSSDNGISIT